MDRDDALDYRMLYGKAVAEIERLRAALAQAMTLLHEMPIKHPQQAERRKALADLVAHDQAIGLYEQSVNEAKE